MTIAIDPKLRIPLRDGVHLSAVLYRPAADAPPGPAVFILTPYTADYYHARGAWFAAHGLTFLCVDTRGRGGSDGICRPFTQERDDGFDIVEWIAAQPFCDGRVGMWGGSYNGMSQWATAGGRPPHLATIVPTASAHAGIDFPARNGVSYQYLLQWLAYIAGPAIQPSLFSDLTFWRGLSRARFERGASFRSLADELGGDWPVLRDWIDRLERSDFAGFAPELADYRDIDLPVLTITGSYDDDQPGALEYYRRHLAHGPAGTRDRHYLVIGPWDHMGTRTPQPRVGGLELGPASLVDMNQLHLEWYRWTMGDGPRPALLERRVAYYVMGAERWRHADSLEAATGRTERLFLRSDGQARGVFSAGLLSIAPPGDEPADVIIHDPRDTAIAAVEVEVDNEDPLESRLLLAREGRHFIFQTAPFDDPRQLTGFFALDAWIAADVPDMDLVARIYEVTDAGTSILLTTDVLRARHRDGVDRPTLIPDDRPIAYRLERFLFTSRRLAAGSRLRLTLGPNHSIHAQPNRQGGGVVSDETFAEARTATIRLLHDAEHPSALTIPIGREDDDAS